MKCAPLFVTILLLPAWAHADSRPEWKHKLDFYRISRIHSHPDFPGSYHITVESPRHRGEILYTPLPLGGWAAIESINGKVREVRIVESVRFWRR